MENKPIIPDTDKPAFLTPDGNLCRGAEEQYHFTCFDSFRTFGDFFNSWRKSTAFRLQELRDTKITYRENDLDLGPNFGHRYDIYYYQFRVGLLQIHASRVIMLSEGLIFSDDIKSTKDCEVSVEVLLDTFSPKAISYRDVREFLHSIARMLSSEHKDCFYTEPQYQGMTQRRYVIYAIEQAMAEAAWDNHRECNSPSPLVLRFNGTPTEWYSHLSAGP